VITETPTAEKAQTAIQLETQLLADLAQINTQSHNESIVLEHRDGAGKLLAGITAETSYGWLYIKIIWVSEALRGQGIGRQLMLAVEDKGRALECHSAWLETSNAAAQPFYLSLGYQGFGILDNAADQQPADHKRWFMRKTL